MTIPRLSFTIFAALATLFGTCTLVIAQRSTSSILIGGLPISESTPNEQSQLILRGYRTLTIDRDYDRAISIFQTLLGQVRDPTTKQTVLALLNTSLYSAGRYRDALLLICKEQRDSSPIPLIFDVHAHIRKLSLEQGYGPAMQLARQLRRDCNMPVFSAVWAGIPLAKMEYLKSGVHVLDEKYSLRDKDKIILMNVITSDPADPYTDFARYFLHDFKNIKDTYLTSLPRTNTKVSQIIIDQLAASSALSNNDLKEILHDILLGSAPELAAGAVFAWLHRSGRIADELTIFSSLDTLQRQKLEAAAVGGVRRTLIDARYINTAIRSAPDSDHLTQLLQTPECIDLSQCVELLTWFPKSWLAERRASEYVASTWARSLQSEDMSLRLPSETVASLAPFADQGSLTTLKAQINRSSRLLSDLANVPLQDRKVALNTLLEKECRSVADCQMVFGYIPDRDSAIELLNKYAVKLLAELPLPHAIKAINELPASLRQRIIEVPNNDAQLPIVALARVYELVGQGDADELVRTASKIKGRPGQGRPLAAANIFNYVATTYPNTPAGEKAHYLLFTTLAHRLGDNRYGNAEETLKRFIAQYPSSKFIDDAYTELGVLEYRNHGDYDAAKRYLEKVYQEYPDSNAADNALYHLALISIERRDYLGAARYLARCLAVYGKNRLAGLAQKIAPATRDAAEAVSDRKALQGIILILDDRYDFPNGLEVSKLDHRFLDTREPVQPGDWLVAIDGSRIRSVRDFYSGLSKRKTGEKVRVLFKRLLDKDTLKDIDGSSSVIIAQMFDVKFVASNDVLNVRERPTSAATKVGSIPPNATCVRVLRKSPPSSPGQPSWFEVDYRTHENTRVSGWASSLFLVKSASCFD